MFGFRSNLYVYSALLLIGFTVGCDSLQDFRTGKGEVFQGTVVGTVPQDAGDAAPSSPFLLYGFPSDTRLELTFDPQAADRSVADVGTVDTYTCEDPALARCPTSKRVAGSFSHAPLSSIPGLGQDVLSRYDFPGGSRVRNFILTAPVETAGGRRQGMVFLSLMESGAIELRIIAAGERFDGGTASDPLFGLFVLERERK